MRSAQYDHAAGQRGSRRGDLQKIDTGRHVAAGVVATVPRGLGLLEADDLAIDAGRCAACAAHDEAFTLTQHQQYTPLEAGPSVDANGVKAKGKGVSGLRARASRWYFGQEIAKPTAAEIDQAKHHSDESESSKAIGH